MISLAFSASRAMYHAKYNTFHYVISCKKKKQMPLNRQFKFTLCAVYFEGNISSILTCYVYEPLRKKTEIGDKTSL